MPEKTVKENVKEYYLVVNYPCKITIQSESEYSLAQLAHANRSCSASIMNGTL